MFPAILVPVTSLSPEVMGRPLEDRQARAELKRSAWVFLPNAKGNP